MSKKHEKVCMVLIFIEHLFILVSTVTGCVSICGFASLVGVSIGIPNLYKKCKFIIKIYALTAVIKKYKSIIKKKKKKHDKIVLLAKTYRSFNF